MVLPPVASPDGSGVDDGRGCRSRRSIDSRSQPPSEGRPTQASGQVATGKTLPQRARRDTTVPRDVKLAARAAPSGVLVGHREQPLAASDASGRDGTGTTTSPSRPEGSARYDATGPGPGPPAASTKVPPGPAGGGRLRGGPGTRLPGTPFTGSVEYAKVSIANAMRSL